MAAKRRTKTTQRIPAAPLCNLFPGHRHGGYTARPLRIHPFPATSGSGGTATHGPRLHERVRVICFAFAILTGAGTHAPDGEGLG